jgi:hypothetical protein
MRDRLSVQRFEVDPDKVFKQLFGKDAETDEHTREITSSVPGAPPRLRFIGDKA